MGGERGIAADSGPGLGPGAELIMAAADAAQDGLLVTDAGTDSRGPRIVYANAAVSRITGYTPEELRGVSPSIFQGAATDRQTLDRLHEALASGHPFKGQAVNYRKDGTPFVMEWTIGAVTDASGTATHYIAVQRDATDFRLRLAEAESRARIDQLTGLDNRRQLESSLEAALPTGTGLSVLIAGVDHLHEVRERHGRLVGDEVLREVGQRLRDSAGEHDSVGRFGDEEFCLVARDLAGPDALREQAERSRRAVGRDPVTTTAGQVSVTVSVGAATADPTASHEAVLRAAERALEAARKNGRDRVELSSSADPR